MNYELAKELKDAGFPQVGMGMYSTYLEQIDPEAVLPSEVIGIASTDSCYVPTLSELIEACGDKFGRLEYTPDVSMNPWWAHERLEGPHNVGDGSTPEESVARLWLALKKN